MEIKHRSLTEEEIQKLKEQNNHGNLDLVQVPENFDVSVISGISGIYEISGIT